MAKAIYTLKMELLFNDNKGVKAFSNKQEKAIHRANHFVVNIYLQSWFTSRDTKNAPYNDILLVQRFNAYSDKKIKETGPKIMVCHSWYLSPELAALAFISSLVTMSQKKALIENMTSERGRYLSKILPNTVE